MDIEQAPGIVRHKTRCQDAHETGQHHKTGRELVNLNHQGRIKRLATGKRLVIQHSCGNALRLGQGQALGIGLVADHCGHPHIQAFSPTFLLGSMQDGPHIGART
eukprot:gene25709-32196_t